MIFKHTTTLGVPPAGDQFSFSSGSLPENRSHHPAWLQATRSLDQYDRWVTQVVLPIAFAWIEEHKDEVYTNIPQELRDDVGVVVAAAFQIVSKQEVYERGRQIYTDVTSGQRADLAQVNPIWAGVSDTIEQCTFDAYKEVESDLDGTILLQEPERSGE